jgi:hypothetical protein
MRRLRDDNDAPRNARFHLIQRDLAIYGTLAPPPPIVTTQTALKTAPHLTC